MVSIYDYSLKDLEEYFLQKGLKPYKAKQLFKWLYEKRIADFDLMSDISKKLIVDLKNDFSCALLKIKTSQKSKDGTIKFLFELNDGAYIESVLMKFDYGYSACISSQVGCNMGCSFCASGLLKKQRDLKVSEIVLQVLMLKMELDKQGKAVARIALSDQLGREIVSERHSGVFAVFDDIHPVGTDGQLPALGELFKGRGLAVIGLEPVTAPDDLLDGRL